MMPLPLKAKICSYSIPKLDVGFVVLQDVDLLCIWGDKESINILFSGVSGKHLDNIYPFPIRLSLFRIKDDNNH